MENKSTLEKSNVSNTHAYIETEKDSDCAERNIIISWKEIENKILRITFLLSNLRKKKKTKA